MEDGARVMTSAGEWGTVIGKSRGEYIVQLDEEFYEAPDSGIRFYGGDELVVM